MRRTGTYWEHIVPVPSWIAKVHEGSYGDEQVKAELEDFEVGSTHFGSQQGRGAGAALAVT